MKRLIYTTALVLCFNNLVKAAQPQLTPFFNKTKMVRNAIPELTKEQKKVLARITFYHKYQDQYGDKLAIGGRAKQGVTIAAHPDFKFGKQLTIPNLQNVIGSSKFVVQDRGTAITSKKASNKRTYVFDIYISAASRREGNKLINKYSNQLGEYTYVYF